MKFDVIEQLYGDQIETLHQLYQHEWWTKGRRLEDLELMLRQSDITVGFCDPTTHELVAFTRVLTDYVYKALIFDVIVDKRFRGQGIGRQLIETVVTHSMLKNVAQFELYCAPELIPFYEEWGFTKELGTLTFMRRAK